MVKPHTITQTIDYYFKNWVIRPTIIFMDLNFKYDERQFIFIRKTKNDNDCHVFIFSDDIIAYIFDSVLIDDDVNTFPVYLLKIISMPLNHLKKSAPIDIPINSKTLYPS